MQLTTSIIDISPPVHAGIAVWPGDTAFKRTVNVSFATGGNLDLSEIRTTVHLGAHADAPSHYVAGGLGIDVRPLDRYLGPCRVVTAHVARGARIQPADLGGAPIDCARILLRTGTFPNPDRFDTDFASLSVELVTWLADEGVVLIGIDTPSVDPFDDPVLHAHRAIAGRDLAVLEGIVLDGAPDGRYTLVALPLRLVGADASPVRAVLLAP